MAKFCINPNSPDVVVMAMEFGVSNAVMAAKIGTYMDLRSAEVGIDDGNFPTIAEMDTYIYANQNAARLGNVDETIGDPDNEDDYTTPAKNRLLEDIGHAQLKNETEEGTDPIEKLNSRLVDLLSPFGVTVKQVDDFRKRKLDSDPNAIADLTNNVIYIAKDRENAYTMPEEAAHFIVELMADDPLMPRLHELVKQEDIYESVKKRYSNIYNSSEDKMAKEAVGQALSHALVNKWKKTPYTPRFIRILQNLMNKLLYRLKKIFRSDNHIRFEEQIGMLADDILAGNTSKWKIEALAKSPGGILLQAGSLQLKTSNAIEDFIKRTNKEIKFDKATHTYTHITPSGKKKKLKSVHGAMYEIGYSPKKMNNLMQYGASIGTPVHDWADDYINGKTYKPRPNHTMVLSSEAKNDIDRILKDTLGPDDILMSEVRVADIANGIAGTIDLISIDKEGNVTIYDYKTKQKGFKDIDRYLVSTREIWSIQQTLYKEILEKGIGKDKVKSINIIKLRPDVEKNVIKSITNEGILELTPNEDYKKVLDAKPVPKDDNRQVIDKEGMTSMNKALESAIAAIDKEIRVKRGQAYGKETTAVTKLTVLMSQLVDDFNERATLHGYAKFIGNLDNAISGTETEPGLLDKVDQIEKALTNDIKGLNSSDAAADLQAIDRYVKAFQPIIAEMLSELKKATLAGDVKQKKLLRELEKVSTNLDLLNKYYYELGIKIFGNFLSGFIGARNDPDSIKKMGDELNLEETLKLADRDISFWALWLNSMVESRDDVLQLVDKAVKDYRNTAMFKGINDQQDILAALEESRRDGNSNEDYVFEKDNLGNDTMNLRSDDGYNWGEFARQKQLMYDRLSKKYGKGKDIKSWNKDEILEKGTEERKAYDREVQAWYNQNMGKEWHEEDAKMRREMDKDEYNVWKNENFYKPWDNDTDEQIWVIKSKSKLSKPAEKYRYKESLTPSQQKFLDTIWRIKHEIDAGLPYKYRHSRLAPQIKKDWVETAKRDGIFKVGKNIAESFAVQPDDVGYGQSADQIQELQGDKVLKDKEARKVLTDERGRVLNYIPIYFTRKLKGKSQSRLSKDIAHTMMAYSFMGRDYAEMTKIVDTLEIGKDIVSNREIIRTTMVGRAEKKVKEVVPSLITRGGKDDEYAKLDKRDASKTYRRYEEFMEMQLYGKMKKEGIPFTVFGNETTTERVIDMFGKYVAINSLAINVYSGINNIALGNSLTRVEAQAGQFFDNKDLAYADKKYYSNVPETISNVGKINPTDKLSLWIKYFNVLYDYDENVHSAHTNRKTRIGQLANTGALFFLNHAGEHYMQTRVSLALSNKIQLTAQDGTKVSLWDAHEVVGNKLVVKEEFKDQVTDDMVKNFINRAHHINHSLHGIYNNQDKSIVQRRAVFRLALMFRKFMVPGINRRFRKLDWIFEANSYQEGYYRTAAKFVYELLKDLKKLEFHLITHWKDLSDSDKANMRRAISEVTYMITVGVTAGIIITTEFGNDDDEWWKSMLAYQVNRLNSELWFYTKPSEFIRLLQSPAAAVDQIEKISHFFGLLNIAKWGEELESGRHRGMTRFNRGLIDIIPPRRTLDKLMSPEEQLKFFTR